jgi:hypothetical protein
LTSLNSTRPSSPAREWPAAPGRSSAPSLQEKTVCARLCGRRGTWQMARDASNNPVIANPAFRSLQPM